jgi:hypothetical protein
MEISICSYDEHVYAQAFYLDAGLSVGRATRLGRPPDTPDRPSRPPDKGQTGID